MNASASASLDSLVAFTRREMHARADAADAAVRLGGAFGVAILAAVFTTVGSYASADAFTDGFAPAMASAAGLSLAAGLIALALPGRRSQAPVAPAGAAIDAPAAKGG